MNSLVILEVNNTVLLHVTDNGKDGSGMSNKGFKIWLQS